MWKCGTREEMLAALVPQWWQAQNMMPVLIDEMWKQNSLYGEEKMQLVVSSAAPAHTGSCIHHLLVHGHLTPSVGASCRGLGRDTITLWSGFISPSTFMRDLTLTKGWLKERWEQITGKKVSTLQTLCEHIVHGNDSTLDLVLFPDTLPP